MKRQVNVFKTGDKVQLISGGPIMTVDELMSGPFQEGKYHCQWFSGSTLKSGYFQHDALKPVTDVPDRLDV